MFINLYICHVEGSEIIKVSGAAKYNNVSWLTNNKRSGGNPRAPEKSEPWAGKRYREYVRFTLHYGQVCRCLPFISYTFPACSSPVFLFIFILVFFYLFPMFKYEASPSFLFFSFLLWNNMDEL
jgi:hypothetical protein